jgi:hypothetical protein
MEVFKGLLVHQGGAGAGEVTQGLLAPQVPQEPQEPQELMVLMVLKDLQAPPVQLQYIVLHLTAGFQIIHTYLDLHLTVDLLYKIISKFEGFAA